MQAINTTACAFYCNYIHVDRCQLQKVEVTCHFTNCACLVTKRRGEKLEEGMNCTCLDRTGGVTKRKIFVSVLAAQRLTSSKQPLSRDR